MTTLYSSLPYEKWKRRNKFTIISSDFLQQAKSSVLSWLYKTRKFNKQPDFLKNHFVLKKSLHLLENRIILKRVTVQSFRLRYHSSELILVKFTHLQALHIHSVIHLDFLLFDCIALAFVSEEENIIWKLFLNHSQENITVINTEADVHEAWIWVCVHICIYIHSDIFYSKDRMFFKSF